MACTAYSVGNSPRLAGTRATKAFLKYNINGGSSSSVSFTGYRTWNTLSSSYLKECYVSSRWNFVVRASRNGGEHSGESVLSDKGNGNAKDSGKNHQFVEILRVRISIE